jgi:caa(3)-type oxidase subunit IV
MNAPDRTALTKEVRRHLRIYGLLLALIGLNVGLTFLTPDRSLRLVAQVTLAVLSGGLVLTYFMHLLSEKTATYLILGGTVILFAALMTLTLVARRDHPTLTEYTTHPPPASSTPSSHVP